MLKHWEFLACKTNNCVSVESLRTLLVIAVLLLSGCGTSGKVTKFGPEPLVSHPIDHVDIVNLLDPSHTSPKMASDDEFASILDAAFRSFYENKDLNTRPVPKQDLPSLKDQRNRIQDRLMMASDAACENYKTILKKKQANWDFYFGTTSIVSGALGTVVGGVRAAKNLSALSGAATGVSAEHSQDYYDDLAASVITKGITQRRKSISEAVACAQKKPISEYTAEKAVADAIVYHGACSLIAGLEAADHAITSYNVNLGIDALAANQFFKPYVAARQKALNGGTSQSTTTPQSQQITVTLALPKGTEIKTAADKPAPKSGASRTPLDKSEPAAIPQAPNPGAKRSGGTDDGSQDPPDCTS